MALFLLAMAGGYCFLGTFLGLRITRAPILSGELAKSPQTTLSERGADLPTDVTAEASNELPSQIEAEIAPVAVPAQIDEESELISASVSADAAPEKDAELPADRAETLGQYQELESTLEAAAMVLRGELGNYRESLIDLETHIRVLQMNLNEVSQLGVLDGAEQSEELGWHDSLDSSRTQLRQLQDNWCARLAGIARVLTKSAKPTDHADLHDEYQQHLLRLLTEQEQHREALLELPENCSDREAVTRLLQELTPLLNCCHTLQQFTQETLVELLVRQDRLDQWDNGEFTDPETQHRNRAGLELWLRQWRCEESNRQRQLSAVMLDVDNCAALNSQWGTRIGNLILNSLGTIINGALRKNRGIDFTVRRSGQQYLFILADTGPRGANSAAERIRQTIEQCYFEHPLGKIQITASAGVSDIRPHDSLNTLFDRLQRAIRTAKQAGRNCAALDEGAGPICLMAPQLRIREHSAATTITEVEEELLQGNTELAAV